ncbi:response regulator transcription factor [Paenibacillus guangzhouensis]|uniref:response regulator transcription factor n=1 Tax=Paenibacillus guangzhouensis TaxID=1473112 RepID=UPI001266900A|nr:response regulator transcription factor [Paenibacillus guangzhouensis]
MNELYKVVVVDDEILVRQGIKHLLHWEQNGFQIVGEASNGKEALALIEELQPQIVLTDIVMPVMDGEELTRIIKTSWPEIEVIVLSSFSEFDYVRASFQSGVSDYILKPHLETGMLLDALRKTVTRIPSRIGTKRVENNMMPIHAVLAKMLSGYDVEVEPQLIAAQLPHQAFYLLGTQQDASRDGESASIYPILESLQALFPAMRTITLSGHSIPGYPEMSMQLLNVNEEDRRALPAKLMLLHPSSMLETGEVKWVLSSDFESISQLRDIYENQLLRLLACRFFLPMDAQLMPSGLPDPSASVKAFPLNPFMEQLRRLQLEEAFQDLRSYIRSLELAYTVDVFEFKSFIGNLVFNAIHLLGRLNYDVKSLDDAKYAYFKAIDEANHVLEVVELLEKFQMQLELYVYADKASQSTNPSMRLLLDYIEEHYAEPISLTEMAKHFHFNPSYLSTFFAAHHHEGFKEHLNRVRIDKAADLLRYSDTSISDIGSMVGYGDHSYFCKVFKRNTGLSPSQYRRQYIQS